MEKRYGVLRLIGSIYKVLGIIVGVVLILSVIGICATSVLGGAAFERMGREFGVSPMMPWQGMGLPLGGLIFGGLTFIYGAGVAITFYAIGEGIFLLLALEENTRATVLLLQKKDQEPEA